MASTTKLGTRNADKLTASSNDTLLDGQAGNDTLSSATFDDVSLSGGDGNDTLVGKDSDLLLDGGAGTDTVQFAADVDSLADDVLIDIENVVITNTTDGSYDFSLQSEALKITGGKANDSILGGGAVDTLLGGAGDDELTAEATDGLIDGGLGRDTVVFAAGVSAAVLVDKDLVNVERVEISNTGDEAYDFSVQSEALVIVGDSGADTVIGGKGADSIVGAAGADQLLGGFGNDTLEGGDDADTLLGGAGNDVLVADTTDVLIDGGVGSDTVRFAADVVTTEGEDAALLDEELTGVERVEISVNTGVALDLSLQTESLTIVGAGGDDTINGGFRSDMITGGEGADSIYGNDGADVIVGESGDALIDGGAGDDTVRYAAGVSDLADDELVGVERIEITNPSGAAYDFSSQGVADDQEVFYILGGRGNDVITGGVNADTILGGMGNDVLIVEASDALIDGGAGSDTVVFVAGVSATELLDKDLVNVERVEIGNTEDATYDFSVQSEALVIVGNEGDDAVTGGKGADSISGAVGDDELVGGAGNDTLLGGDGADTLDGGAGNDSVLGGAGNDLLTGGAGADMLLGGDGADVLVAEDTDMRIDGGSNAVTGVTVEYDTVKFAKGVSAANLADADLVGIERVEITNSVSGKYDFSAQKEALSIYGAAADDYIIGSQEWDSIRGGGGNDTLSGGRGRDYFDIDSGNDTVTDLEVRESVNIGDGATLTAIGVKDFRLINFTGSGVLTTTGTAKADKLWGSSIRDSILGLDGNDTIDAGDGDDTVRGGQGNDSIFGGNGHDSLTGDEGNDTLDGGIGDDTLIGGIGSDSLIGGDGDDSLDGGEGEDTISGGAGNDTVIGGLGKDSLDGGDGDDSLDGGDGNDTLDGGNGNDTVIGGAGNDSLDGGAGDDSLDGGEGDDTIHGGDGNDTIAGGAGVDSLTGGNGNDVFLINPLSDLDGLAETLDGGAGNDRIELLEAGALDLTSAVITSVETLWYDEGGNDVEITAEQVDPDNLGRFTAFMGSADYPEDILRSRDASLDLSGVSLTYVDEVRNTTTLSPARITIDDAMLGGSTGVQTIGFAEAGIVGTLATNNDTLDVSDITLVNVDRLIVDADGNASPGTEQTIMIAPGQLGTGVNQVSSFAAGNPDAIATLKLSSAGTIDLNALTLVNIDSVSGSTGDDHVIGYNDKPDTILGGAGADILNGGTGAGPNTLSYADITSASSHGPDLQNMTGIAVNLSASNLSSATVAGVMGVVLGGSTTSPTLANLSSGQAAYLVASGNDTVAYGVRDTLYNFDNVTGSSLSDYLLGSTGDNVLSAGSGNDYLRGDDGKDLLKGGSGNDTLSGEADDDALYDVSGVNDLYIGDGSDRVFFTSSSDAATYKNLVHGDAGATTMMIDGSTTKGYVGDLEGTVNRLYWYVADQDQSTVTVNANSQQVISFYGGDVYDQDWSDKSFLGLYTGRDFWSTTDIINSGYDDGSRPSDGTALVTAADVFDWASDGRTYADHYSGSGGFWSPGEPETPYSTDPMESIAGINVTQSSWKGYFTFYYRDYTYVFYADAGLGLGSTTVSESEMTYIGRFDGWGPSRFQFYEVDGFGNLDYSGNTVEPDARPPMVLGAVDLDSNDDSGASNGDNVTDVVADLTFSAATASTNAVQFYYQKAGDTEFAVITGITPSGGQVSVTLDLAPDDSNDYKVWFVQSGEAAWDASFDLDPGIMLTSANALSVSVKNDVAAPVVSSISADKIGPKLYVTADDAYGTQFKASLYKVSDLGTALDETALVSDNNPAALSVAAQTTMTEAVIGVSDALGNSTTHDSKVWLGRDDSADVLDRSSAEAKQDWIFGFDGNDSLNAGGGDDWVYGDDGSDTIDGGAGSDTLTGGDGNDSILGGDGSDTITGGTGADFIDAGAGADTLVFEATGASNGTDVISGFTVGAVDDVLDFSNFLSTGSFSASDHVVSGEATVPLDVTNKVVQLYDAGDNTIANVDQASDVEFEFRAGGNLTLSTGGKAVVISGENTSASNTAYIWFIDNSLDGDAAGVSVGDIVLVGTIASFQLGGFAANNFVF